MLLHTNWNSHAEGHNTHTKRQKGSARTNDRIERFQQQKRHTEQWPTNLPFDGVACPMCVCSAVVASHTSSSKLLSFAGVSIGTFFLPPVGGGGLQGTTPAGSEKDAD